MECVLTHFSFLQEAVEVLVRAGMRNPIRINVATTRQNDGKTEKVKDLNQKTPSSLRVEYVVCSLEEKTEQLVGRHSESTWDL